MIVMQVMPAALSMLLLAAHFLRAEQLLLATACVILPGLLLVYRPWSVRTLQALLVLGAFEWLRTLLNLAQLRMQLGESWVRMAAILGVVALFSTISALLLQSRAMARRYGLQPWLQASDRQ
jgi:asparagine N-glycosylation enzyme membrane subunit Stt3